MNFTIGLLCGIPLGMALMVGWYMASLRLSYWRWKAELDTLNRHGSRAAIKARGV